MSLYIGKDSNDTPTLTVTRNPVDITSIQNSDFISAADKVLCTATDNLCKYSVITLSLGTDYTSVDSGVAGISTYKLTSTGITTLVNATTNNAPLTAGGIPTEAKPYVVFANNQVVNLPSTHYEALISAVVANGMGPFDGAYFSVSTSNGNTSYISLPGVANNIYVAIFDITLQYPNDGTLYTFEPTTVTFNSGFTKGGTISVSTTSVDIGGQALDKLPFISRDRINDYDLSFQTYPLDPTSGVHSFQLLNSTTSLSNTALTANGSGFYIKQYDNTREKYVFNTDKEMVLWKPTLQLLQFSSDTYSGNIGYYGKPEKQLMFTFPSSYDEALLVHTGTSGIFSTLVRNGYAYAFPFGISGNLTTGYIQHNAHVVCTADGQIWWWNNPPAGTYPEALTNTYVSAGKSNWVTRIFGGSSGVTAYSLHTYYGIWNLIPITFK